MIRVHALPEYTNSAPVFFNIAVPVPNAVLAVSTPEPLRTNTIVPVAGEPPPYVTVHPPSLAPPALVTTHTLFASVHVAVPPLAMTAAYAVENSPPKLAAPVTVALSTVVAPALRVPRR